jgi:two-component system cell cycle response regulator
LVEEGVNGGKPVSLLIFDIDYFKSVNDNYGHPAGDAVLKEFAQRISQNVRGVDLACRLGGEEFVVVMPDTDLSYALMVAERLRQKVAEVPFHVEPTVSISVTVSIGIGVSEGTADCAAKLLERADAALYKAKREGRNRVVAEAA